MRALHALCARWLEPRAALESAPGALAALRLAVHTQRCSEPQARGLAVLFAEAGYVTARDALGNALAACLEDPARARWLRRPRARRASVARFVEESLRYDPPVVQFARTATRDAALRGSAVRAGDRVLVFFAAANRDPSAYSRPDRFDPTRATSAHLALGAQSAVSAPRSRSSCARVNPCERPSARSSVQSASRCVSVTRRAGRRGTRPGRSSACRARACGPAGP